MQEIILVVVTALISGLLATLLTIWWQRRNNIYNRKMRIFETIMATRFMVSSEESVRALNSIDVVFYKNKDVRVAYQNFLNETDKKPPVPQSIEDKHLKLLEVMSKALKLKDIQWDQIKHTYYPEGLAQKIEEENVLRKMQIQNVAAGLHDNESQKNVPSSEQFNQQLVASVLPELIKNPESLEAMIEFSKAQGGKK